ncbi:hypothetical protein D9758_000559 [Tetrapyrgos nigripes]|uniref:Wbp11/ELF5/Saf1 N-terminal domain-containing protein n=1 Tax=Tetrapyrgos nigripes TaxID=182062 RepID=A0A8H5LZF7_9AGAR|nr:hypothetical protein D9758_000559 [Tetrapyrgos nigripes]
MHFHSRQGPAQKGTEKGNKAERSKAKDFALVKKDTSDIQDEIDKLSALPNPTSADKGRLSSLQLELENINKKKEEYVKEHPEQRKLVYRARRSDKDKDAEEREKEERERITKKKRNLFLKNGLPKHPERSIYYDLIMNPYGVAPPGMPYMERPLLPGEVDSEAEDSDEDSDDDIVMPEGPPPGAEEEVDSDEDIPMPDGPPPDTEDSSTEPQGDIEDESNPPLPPGPPPLPPGPPPISTFMSAIPPPPHPGFPMTGIPPPPPPPAGFPLPPGPPPLGFPSFPPFPPNTPFPMNPLNTGLPPPPPGFYPRSRNSNPNSRNQSTGSIQDPLSSIPHQTYQAHQASRAQGHPSLPPKPAFTGASTAHSGPGPSQASAAAVAAATISAEPQLRDFKKEATAFVPSKLAKRKRGAGGAGSGTGAGSINAAPSVSSADGMDAEGGVDVSGSGFSEGIGEAKMKKPDLLGTLRGQFPFASPASTTGAGNKKAKVDDSSSKGKEKEKKKDDYEKFVEEIERSFVCTGGAIPSKKNNHYGKYNRDVTSRMYLESSDTAYPLLNALFLPMSSSPPLKGGGWKPSLTGRGARKKMTRLLKPITSRIPSIPIPKSLGVRGHKVEFKPSLRSEPPDSLKSLVQSSEPYPILKDLVTSVVSLRFTVDHLPYTKENEKLAEYSCQIIEAVAKTFSEIIPDPTQIPPEMAALLSQLTKLFNDIGDSLSLSRSEILSSVELKDLRRQLYALHSDVVGKGSQSVQSPCSRIKQTLRPWSGMLDGTYTFLQVVAQSSDPLPPLKSASAGIVACWDVSKRAKNSKLDALDLLEEIGEILDNAPSQPDLPNDIQRRLNRNEEILSKCKNDRDRIYRKTLAKKEEEEKTSIPSPASDPSNNIILSHPFHHTGFF